MGGPLVALPLGLLIGGLLGVVGAGGSILTVPLLVYVAGEPIKDATTESLLIVALAAAAGAAVALRERLVDVRTAAPFAAAAVAGALLGTAVNRAVDPDALLAGFGLVLVAAAAAVRRTRGIPSRRRRSVLRIAAFGLGTGVLTGLFGVGGGFVIIPALVLGLGLPIDVAVGSSLLVIAVAGAAGFVAHAWTGPLDWPLTLALAAAAVVGTVAGRHLARRVPRREIAQAFAVLLAVVGVGTIVDGVARLG